MGGAAPAGAATTFIELANGPTPTINDAGANQTSMTADVSNAASFNVYNSDTDGTASGIYTQAGGTSGIVIGPAAVIGDSATSIGLVGAASGSGAQGVFGVAIHGYGVQGLSDSSGFAGVRGGCSGNGQGVIGTVSGTGAAVQGENDGSTGPGVLGTAGPLSGITEDIAGVVGDSQQSFGVAGYSADVSGVVGVQGAKPAGVALSQPAGVIGQSVSNYGVAGVSQSQIGVIGASISDSPAVLGTNGGNGPGVMGQTGTGSGPGVEGFTFGTGPGVYAVSNGQGNALDVVGTATFSRSGLVSIAAGASTATVTGVALTAQSIILANLQNKLTGVLVECVVPNVTANSFMIVLSKAVPAGKKATVGWFVVN
jgi:hypothetical protein